MKRLSIRSAVWLLCVWLGRCGLPASAQVYVWGTDSVNVTAFVTNVPPSATNVIARSAGEGHCLSLRRDGTVVA